MAPAIQAKIRCLLIACMFVFVSVVCSHAEDEWQHIFQNLSSDSEITPGVMQNASLYSADAVFTITNNNGFANDFNDNDVVSLAIKGNGVELPAFTGNKTQLIAWAEENKADLLKAIFGNAPDSATSGMADSSTMVQNLFSTAYASPEASGTSFVPISNRDIVIKGQYDFMEVNNFDGTGSSGMLAYAKNFGEDRDKAFGISIPYRQLDLDDNMSTEYKHVSFIPHFKKRWFMDRSLIEWTVHGVFGLTYLDSAIFADGGGYYDYGAGTGAKYAYAINEKLSLNGGLMFQAVKREIKDDFVPVEVKWVADALNDTDTVVDLTPSIGMFWNIVPKTFSFRGELFRIHQLQDDVISGYENQTVALGVFNFHIKKFRIALGYKRSFELEDITDQSIIASLRYKW